ncbi:MAG: hypothetical protein HY240_09495 [Actinobacteria bacterium]|nr:hypothetical protein [Actinomycetota bacterium]
MVQMLIGAVSAAWTAFAIDAILETARTQGSAIWLFGRSIALVSPAGETAVLTLLGASVGVVLGFVASSAFQRLRARILRVAVQRRQEERSMLNAKLIAKNDLLAWRIDELEAQTDRLLARRAKLESDLTGVAVTTAELREKVRRGEEKPAELGEDLVVLPELDPLEEHN